MWIQLYIRVSTDGLDHIFLKWAPTHLQTPLPKSKIDIDLVVVVNEFPT